MTTFTRAIRFANLDEARQVLRKHCRYDGPDIFDDSGEEPQGLLAVVSSDRVPERIFYRLFDAGKGSVVDIQVIDYSGHGPPAAEQDYMGFVSEEKAYVLEGRRFAIEIPACPLGARDIYHLEAMVLDGDHPMNRELLEDRLQLGTGWDFDDLYELIATGRLTGQRVDQLLHE